MLCVLRQIEDAISEVAFALMTPSIPIVRILTNMATVLSDYYDATKTTIKTIVSWFIVHYGQVNIKLCLF